MFDGTAGGLIGFASGALIYKFATSLVQFDESKELF
jgi:hypothetical protein